MWHLQNDYIIELLTKCGKKYKLIDLQNNVLDYETYYQIVKMIEEGILQ